MIQKEDAAPRFTNNDIERFVITTVWGYDESQKAFDLSGPMRTALADIINVVRHFAAPEAVEALPTVPEGWIVGQFRSCSKGVDFLCSITNPEGQVVGDMWGSSLKEAEARATIACAALSQSETSNK